MYHIYRSGIIFAGDVRVFQCHLTFSGLLFTDIRCSLVVRIRQQSIIMLMIETEPTALTFPTTMSEQQQQQRQQQQCHTNRQQRQRLLLPVRPTTDAPILPLLARAARLVRVVANVLAERRVLTLGDCRLSTR